MTEKQILREIVRGAYDIQKLRIQTGNRIGANLRAKLGITNEPSKTTAEAKAEKEKKQNEKEEKKLLEQARAEFKAITENVKDLRKVQFDHEGVISDYTELVMINHFTTLARAEKEHFGHLRNVVVEQRLWKEFLESVKGVGPAMAGVILSEIDIHKARYPSSLWKYAGLDVAADGAGRSRKKAHQIEVTYTNKAGEEDVRNSITFNPFLKTKLTGVLGPSFIRAGSNKYEQIYRDYKARLENHQVHKEKTKGHRNNMAIRYMIKQFLVDLHCAWRAIEGLEVSVPYSEAKLGLVHGKERGAE